MKLKDQSFAVIAKTLNSISHKWFNENNGLGNNFTWYSKYYINQDGKLWGQDFKPKDIPIYTEAKFERLLKAEQEFTPCGEGDNICNCKSADECGYLTGGVVTDSMDDIKKTIEKDMNTNAKYTLDSYQGDGKPVHPDDAFNPGARLESYDKEYELLKDYEDPNGRVAKGVVKKEYQWMTRFALLNPGDCGIKTDWFKEVNKPTDFIYEGVSKNTSNTITSPSAKEISEFERKAYDILKKGVEEGAIFNPVGRSAEDNTVKKDLRAIPYQRCPICNGHGRITNFGTSSSLYDVCSVCNGAKIIPMCIMGREVVASDNDISSLKNSNLSNPDMQNEINITNLVRDYIMGLSHTKGSLIVNDLKVMSYDPEIGFLLKKYNVTRK